MSPVCWGHVFDFKYMVIGLLLISTVSSQNYDSLYISRHGLLLPRQDACSNPDNKRCAVPAERFCCPSTAECIPLNNGTDAICCAQGEDCSFVRTVTCTSSLQKCGNTQCCPIGYDCDTQTTGQPGCKLQEANKPPSYKLRDQCAQLESENGGNFGGTTKSCLELIEATKQSCMDQCNKFPAKAIVTGFFPGLAAGALIMFLIGLWMRKKEKMEAAPVDQGSSTREKGLELRNPSSGFAAARASRRVKESRDGRSLQRNNTLGTTRSTEIDIAYDWKQDENFSYNSIKNGRATPESSTSSIPSTGIQRVQSPRAYDSNLKSQQNVIAEEEVLGSDSSRIYSTRGQVKVPSIPRTNSIKSNRQGMKTPSPAPSSTSRKPIPAQTTPPAELPAMSAVMSPSSSYSRQTGTPEFSTSYPHPYTTPPPQSRSPVPAPFSTPPSTAPLTQHYLQQLQTNAPPVIRRAQSPYSASSFASTNLDSPSTASSDSEADSSPNLDQTNLAPPGQQRRKKSRRPPSDVVSCITDGEHDDGLTTFSELAAAGQVPKRHTRSTSGGAAGSELSGQEEERIVVDRGQPPPLPEGYIIGEGGMVKAKQS